MEGGAYFTLAQETRFCYGFL